MAGFKSPVRYSLHSQNYPQASEFAGLPVGVELLTKYRIFNPFANFSASSIPGAATDPGLGWTVTEVGAGGTVTIPADPAAGVGRIQFTTDAADNDIQQAQYTAAGSPGEEFLLRSSKINYFNCQWSLNDAADLITTVQQADVFMGFAITDTSIVAGVTDYIGFYKADGSGVVNFVAGKNSTTLGDQISQTTGITLVAADAGVGVSLSKSFSFVAIGTDVVLVYANGAHVATVRSTTQLPNDEVLCATILVQNGEAVAKNLNVFNYLAAYQI